MTVRKRLTRIVRLLRGGRIIIPADFRRALGIGADTPLQLRVEGEVLRIRKVPPASEEPGSPWLAERYRRFAPMRQEAIEKGHTEEEIDAVIARVVGGVRSRRARQGRGKL